MPDFDLLVIGGGSGGVRAARRAAELGAEVALVEQGALGGVCVNVGCIPKKHYVNAAEIVQAMGDGAAHGVSGRAHFDLPALLASKNRHVRRLNELYREALEKAGVRLIQGRARLTGGGRAQVGSRRLAARHILLATGSSPRALQIPGAELAKNSDDMFELSQLPEKALIIGGGYIALEFAGILHRWGVEVEVVYRGELLLRGFDDDLRRLACEQMAAAGMRLRFNVAPRAIAEKDDGLEVEFDAGSAARADLVLAAIGRDPNTADLGLENTAARLDERGCVVVDRNWRSAEPDLLAIGDVSGSAQLTPLAIAQAEAVIHNLFAAGAIDADDIPPPPTAVFGLPQLASAGLSEEEAKRRHGEIEVYKSRFKALKQSLAPESMECLVKLVALPGDDGRVLGAHMIGENAAEIIQSLAVALNANVKFSDFRRTLALHPTVAEEFLSLKLSRPTL